MAQYQKLQFNVFAPGKVILHGEHSVVYGQPALAGVIGLRNRLNFIEQTQDTSVLFSFQVMNMVLQLDVQSINDIVSRISPDDHSVLLEDLRKYLKERFNLTENQDLRKFNASLALIYLMCGIFATKKFTLEKGFSLELTSEIKIGAGLGSSASFAVCLATAFLVLASRKGASGKHLSPEEKSLISEWAFNSEKIMHGKPSGIDNTICTFGGIVKFTKGLPVEQIQIRANVNILLVDTKVDRSTARLVKNVADLKQKFPKLLDTILSAMGTCVDEAVRLYERELQAEDGTFDQLLNIFEINNGLLRSIGVSHPKLEELFLIAQRHGFGSKLTGAGGGGYGIVLLPSDYKSMEKFNCLCADLQKGGFEWTETVIGGSGVDVEFY